MINHMTYYSYLLSHIHHTLCSLSCIQGISRSTEGAVSTKWMTGAVAMGELMSTDSSVDGVRLRERRR